MRTRPRDAFHRIVLDDLRSPRGVAGAVKRDFRDLYDFYLDDEERGRLDAMGGFRRTLYMGWLLFKALMLALSPARRLLILGALALALLPPQFRLESPKLQLEFHTWPVVAFVFLAVLAFELKDKLLARDEIDVARQVQMSLLPKEHPAFAGWEIWSSTSPANDVGGDLVDYLPLDSGRLGIVLGDVAGKGMGAALLCAKLQATLRALAPSAERVDRLAERVNAILLRDGLDNRYATAVYLEIEADRPRLRAVNAGHNPAVLIGKEGVRRFPASSYPLGLLPDPRYREEILEVGAGELIVVFSDGLTEARAPDGEEYGEARLEAVLRRRHETAEAAGRAVLADVERFRAGARLHDDLSIVALRRTC